MKSTKSKKNHQKLLQTDCHIGIIGSGLGGLAAALAILQCDASDVKKQNKRAKHNEVSKSSEEKHCDASTSSKFQGRITIYERDQHATDRKEGYGMTLTYNPSGPLAQLDILESIARQDCPSRSHYLFNEKGDVMGYYGNAFYGATADHSDDEKLPALRGAGQRGNLRIPRSDLRKILMEKIKELDSQNDSPRVHMAWGKRLISYIDTPAQAKLNQIHISGKEADNEQCACHNKRPVLLEFEDGTTDEVDLLIGADGVNSVVARRYLSTAIPAKSNKPNPSADTAPKYTGIFIIIGISDHLHPLIDERGYYTLDGERRLFIMPFAGNRLDNQRRRTMWQLSYPVADRDEAIRLSRLSPEELQNAILNLCGDWHEPFPEMVKQTPLDTIWGTGLLDRDPSSFIRHRQQLEVHGRLPSHVVLLGDAAHAMTPFKGQGANQALADGPLLAKWLSQAKFESAVRGFMTEMARRSEVKVRASREAAMKLHSKDCWKWIASQDGVDNNAIFHGVNPDSIQTLLSVLRRRSIGASLGSALDESICTVIKQLNISDTVTSRVSPEELHFLEERALRLATSGDLVGLRELSRRSQFLVQKVLDGRHRSCLHLAAEKNHLDVCLWLLSEARVDPKVRDENSKTALDIANECGHDEISHLIQSSLKRGLHDGGKSSCSEETCDATMGPDLYRQIEQQLRPVRTMKELRLLLQTNRQNTTTNHQNITHVLGCPIDILDEETHRDREIVLAREHGAVVVRNFVSREVDQLALGAIALRPLCLEIPRESDLKDLLQAGVAKKKVRKQIEEIKSRISIPADSSIIVQTNFAPQILSQNSGNASKKRKIESVPLSKLRYLNLGEYNYNWGDRKYDRIPGALSFPKSFTALARRAYDMAQQKINNDSQLVCTYNKSTFDMAICNFYHLQRPSDRLGGHKDDVESDLTSPLITVSLGSPGVFLLGGTSRSSVPTAILLRSGDVMILSGRSRYYFHGVPTILEYEHDETLERSMVKNEIIFPELNGDWLSEGAKSSSEATETIPSFNELLFMKVFLATARMNISIRRI